MEAREWRGAKNRRGEGSGEITVFALLDFFPVLFDVAGLSTGLSSSGLVVMTSKSVPHSGRGNHLAFVEPIFIDIQISFAFGAQNHKASLAD